MKENDRVSLSVDLWELSLDNVTQLDRASIGGAAFLGKEAGEELKECRLRRPPLRIPGIERRCGYLAYGSFLMSRSASVASNTTKVGRTLHNALCCAVHCIGNLSSWEKGRGIAMDGKIK